MNSDVMLRNYGKARQKQFIQEAQAGRIRSEIIAKAEKRARQQYSFAFGSLWPALRRMLRVSFRGVQIDEPI